MKNDKRFTLGICIVITLLIISVTSLFMPFIVSEYGMSIIDFILGKTVNEQKVISAFSIYSFLTLATVVLPLGIMIIVNLAYIQRVKKYITDLFFGIWFLVGVIFLMVVLKVPFDDARWGFGFLLAIISSVAITVVSIVASFKDKTNKKQKTTAWYKGISTFIMIINIPCLFIGITSFIVFREILSLLSFFNVIALVCLISASAISCVVTINEYFGVHKYGYLHFLTGILTFIAFLGLFYNSGTTSIIFGLIFAIIFLLAWGLLGMASTNVIQKRN